MNEIVGLVVNESVLLIFNLEELDFDIKNQNLWDKATSLNDKVSMFQT